MSTMLITGGTGSFGRAFTDFMLANMSDNDSLRILSRDEQKQEQMKREVDDWRVRYLLGDVRDLERVRRALRTSSTMAVSFVNPKPRRASRCRPAAAPARRRLSIR